MQPIEFYSTESLTAFLVSVIDQSGQTQSEIGGKLGISQPAINHAVSDKYSDDIRYNGTRIRILYLFGYNVETKAYFKISK